MAGSTRRARNGPIELGPPGSPARKIVLGENLEVLARLPERFARLVYVDPPFNTRRTQRRERMRAVRDEDGDRTGFGGRRYRTERLPSASFPDRHDDYVEFVVARVRASLRCCTADASLFVHLDPREVHYVKVALDGLLGRERFVNEIVWAYDYGGRSTRCWPRKHDTILWYALDPGDYVFDAGASDRLPYLAPRLVTPEKARRGKLPTDVWWHTIVPTNGREKTGYPTQKPLGLVERIVRVHSAPGDVVLDYFAGSGTTGEAAARNARGFVLVDSSRDAVRVCARRLAQYAPEPVGFRVARDRRSVRDA